MARTNWCPVHEQVAACARLAPNDVAAVDEGERLTYAELDARAAAIAQALLDLGVRRGELVGVCLERGVSVAPAVVGVLAAGAAYLPLDPALPAQRLGFMLERARVSRVIVEAATEARVQMPGLAHVRIDRVARAPERAAVAVGPNDLAYVIFTSGTTGTPKGAMLEHGGLANLARAQREGFAIARGSRVLQFASMGFDASVSEIFTALTAGAELHFAERHELLPGALENLLRRRAISVVTLPPSLLARMSESELPDLKTLVSAGEPCTAAIANRWAKGRRFVNAYGPTETTVCASLAICEPSDDAPPIGDALDGMCLHVVDETGRLAREGELCVGGVGVARGYLANPELTAERFVPDPFDGRPGARMYRTGDRVRRRPDGAIEFLGRFDDQLKLRGFRIEPREIEHALRRGEGVTDAVVVAREVRGGDAALVAYVCGNVDGDALRRALADSLPEYMIPAHVVVLDRLPLTPNGKIDRAALPAPAAGARERSADPATPVERALAAIWREMLEVEHVGREDDFFWLGGHSLMAAQMLARAGKTLGCEVSFALLFETRATIAAIAGGIVERLAAGADAALFDEVIGEIEMLSERDAEARLTQLVREA